MILTKNSGEKSLGIERGLVFIAQCLSDENACVEGFGGENNCWAFSYYVHIIPIVLIIS